LFSVIQKAVGEQQAVKLRFNINKHYNSTSDEYEIIIDWKEEFIK
jgi:hypothetical protein